jgi:hypothetical protein
LALAIGFGGSWTPFGLLGLNGAMASSVLIAVWSVALAERRSRWLEVGGFLGRVVVPWPHPSAGVRDWGV